MSIVLNGTTGITTPTYGGAVAAEYIAPVTSFKNRIINGAMQIDQRNAGASVSVTSVSQQYPVDRFQVQSATDGTITAQKSTVAPTGFINSLLCTVSVVDSSLAAGQIARIRHKIEGLNVADLGWGTANAQPVTFSFTVRSSVTGTFGGYVINSASNRSYPFSFVINSANTFEQKTITIQGDTSGTWLTTTGVGLEVGISLGAGSTFLGTANTWAGAEYFSVSGATNLMATLNATFYITGVQLEKGSTATSFDYRPYGTELALCQRYYETSINAGVSGTLSLSVPSNTVPALCAYGQTYYSVLKRAPATVTVFGNQGGVTRVSNWNSGVDFAANSGRVNGSLLNGFNMWNNSGSTLSTEYFAVIYNYRADAEL
jgi:hypothetical protein